MPKKSLSFYSFPISRSQYFGCWPCRKLVGPSHPWFYVTICWQTRCLLRYCLLVAIRRFYCCRSTYTMNMYTIRLNQSDYYSLSSVFLLLTCENCPENYCNVKHYQVRLHQTQDNQLTCTTKFGLILAGVM